jgi:hypothetical protein
VISAPVAARPGDELDESREVLRLVPDALPFVPPGQPGVNGEAFVPSTADKKEAEQRQQPVRVSVWDTQRTTLAQARQIHGRSDTIVVVLGVVDIVQIRAELSAPRLRVVWDPRAPEDGPGADGHCGIEGLDRPREVPRPVHKAIWDELARRARQVA